MTENGYNCGQLSIIIHCPAPVPFGGNNLRGSGK